MKNAQPKYPVSTILDKETYERLQAVRNGGVSLPYIIQMGLVVVEDEQRAAVK